MPDLHDISTESGGSLQPNAQAADTFDAEHRFPRVTTGTHSPAT